MKTTCLSVLSAVLLFSCAKNEIVDDVTTADAKINKETTYASNRDNQDAINVVFFYPNDITPNETEIKNFGKCVRFAQRWYTEQMELNGYGKKTFALPTSTQNKNKVHVKVIIGSGPTTDYPNNKKVMEDINNYYAEHPDEKFSRYHVVAFPYLNDAANNDQIGKIWGSHEYGFCFIRGKENFNLQPTGKYVDDLEILTYSGMGTLIHELGHLFGAPHVCGVASELPVRSIMGQNGTFKWNDDPTLIVATEISTAIWNVSEQFNKTNDGINYDIKQPNPEITNLQYSVKKDDGKGVTVAQVTFTSNTKPNTIWVGLDPLQNNGSGSGGYAEVGFPAFAEPTTNPNEYTATIEMPYTDYFIGNRDNNKINNGNSLSIEAIFENWKRIDLLKYNFSITDAPTPDDNINSRSILLSDRAAWSVTANTTSTEVSTMIDGDTNTYWQSTWPYRLADRGPHIIDVDMGATETFNGVYLDSNRNSSTQFWAQHAIVEVSTDGNTYQQVGSYRNDLGSPKAFIEFPNEVTGRYIRISIDEVYRTQSWSAENMIISELDILK